MPRLLISASRRTDIPACRSRWFFDRLADGFVTVSNPYDSRKQKTVSLLPQDVLGIVFWSKNPEPLLTEADRLKDYRWSVNFTVTGYDSRLEPGLPPLEERLETFGKLASILGPSKLQWRFDPILFTEGIGERETVDRFQSLVRVLAGMTTACVLSFYQPYAAAQRRLKSRPVIDVSDEVKNRLASRLENLASENGMTARWCCQDWAYDRPAGHCVDASLFSPESGFPKDKGQRTGCTCDKSVDIGSYNLCPLGCLYCYANR